MKTYTVGELAVILKYNKEYLRQKIKRGDIPAVKIGGKWLVMEEEVKRMLGVNE